MKIFYSWEHILKSINEIRSFSLSHQKCPIRIGGQAVSYKNHNYPKESIDGFVRFNGPEKHLDTMQGNIFTAILVNAGLGCVEKDHDLKRMPKVFTPSDLFFPHQTGDKIDKPDETKIRRLWNSKKRFQKHKRNGDFFSSFVQFREWYLSQYESSPTCHYCGIPEPLIEKVYWDLRKTKRPKTRLKLEIDRLDPNGNYNGGAEPIPTISRNFEN